MRPAEELPPAAQKFLKGLVAAPIVNFRVAGRCIRLLKRLPDVVKADSGRDRYVIQKRKDRRNFLGRFEEHLDRRKCRGLRTGREFHIVRIYWWQGRRARPCRGLCVL